MIFICLTGEKDYQHQASNTE